MSDRRLRDWDVLCTACELQVGQLIRGRFVHHAECPLVSRIGAGALRCCACGSEVRARELPATASADEMVIDDAPTAADEARHLAPITPFGGRRAVARGSRGGR